MIVSMNVSHFVKICQVLTILHRLICRSVANFGTRCIYLQQSRRKTIQQNAFAHAQTMFSYFSHLYLWWWPGELSRLDILSNYGVEINVSLLFATVATVAVLHMS